MVALNKERKCFRSSPLTITLATRYFFIKSPVSIVLWKIVIGIFLSLEMMLAVTGCPIAAYNIMTLLLKGGLIWVLDLIK